MCALLPAATVALLSRGSLQGAAQASDAPVGQSRWNVLQDTDWLDNCPGGNTCAVSGTSAGDCADACKALDNCVATSFNAKTDRCCNFKCSTKRRVSLKGEQGVVVRPGADTCGQQPPPPPPSVLCPPATIPPDWLAPCLAGDLFFEPATGPQQSADLLPEVTNGHVGWKVRSDTVYVAGLFNGPAGSLSEADGNSRARVPPYSVNVSEAGPSRGAHAHDGHTGGGGSGVVGGGCALLAPAGQALDVRRALFAARSTAANGTVSVEERWYAPLHRPRLLVYEVTATASAAAIGPVTIALSGGWAGPPSQDLKLAPFAAPAGIVALSGANVAPELDGAAPTWIAVAATEPPATITVCPGETMTVHVVQAFVTSDNSSDVQSDAIGELTAAVADPTSLLPEHEAAWALRVAAGGGAEIEGDLWLAQAINASLYFIRSSIRPDWPRGLSPGGLASNGYGGHTFWDQEVWMWPPLLLVDPECARSALQYRYDRIPHAHNKSAQCGQLGEDDPSAGIVHAWCPASYAAGPPQGGVMFPWESAATGTEVQTTHGTCGPWCKYEQHISADVSFAARQFWYATGDRAWLRDVGWPIVSGVASFYAARAEPDPRNRSEFHINMVMGPDEYAWPVNDSAYTNAVARIALDFAVEVAGVLGLDAPLAWSRTAAGLVVPFSGTVPGHAGMQGGYHPEYSGFTCNRTVKQADTVLLSFPLGVPMPPDVLANDLEVYTIITSPGGPAMTWAIFAVGWMEVALQSQSRWAGNYSQAAHFFNRGYANVQRPFNVWRETPGGGAVNFITGAGGFLQSVLFGSTGMRLEREGLTFDPPPPSASGGAATSVGVRLSYKGSQLLRRTTAAGGVDVNTSSGAPRGDAGCRVVTELVSAGPTALYLVDYTADPAKSVMLKTGTPIGLPCGRAAVTTNPGLAVAQWQRWAHIQ